MLDALDIASQGLQWPDLGLLILRVAVGSFFAISGWHKLFTPARHARLKATLIEDKVPFPSFNEWWVPAWELLAGVGLVVGMLTAFNAVVLVIVCSVACWAESREKVRRYAPIDFADVVDDYLYLPEVLYLVMLVAIAISGPGAISVDGWLS